MLRQGLYLTAWCGLAVGVFAMLFGGEQGGLTGMGPWSAIGAALIGLGVCVHAVRAGNIEQAIAEE